MRRPGGQCGGRPGGRAARDVGPAGYPGPVTADLPAPEPAVPAVPAVPSVPAAPAAPHRGVFVAVEGGDGAGKSTQLALLRDWLVGAGAEVLLTREPGGTELGVVLREALMHGGHVAPRAEALLYAADRAHHVATLVRPALDRGAVVVTDRYLDSSVAYQGDARGLGAGAVRDLNLWAVEGLLPDLVVLLDLDPAVGAARRAGTPDRIEAEPDEFHRSVRARFLDLAAADPGRYLVLDAAREPLALHADIRAALAPLLAPLPDRPARAGTAAP